MGREEEQENNSVDDVVTHVYNMMQFYDVSPINNSLAPCLNVMLRETAKFSVDDIEALH